MFSFFSRSRSKGRYPDPHHGGSYYKRNILFGSGSFSDSYGRRSYDYPYPPQMQTAPPTTAFTGSCNLSEMQYCRANRF